MNSKELKTVLEDHQLWLYEEGGKHANLSDANLWNSNLWNSIGNRREIKSILVAEEYSIVYTADYLQIGCERHKITDWWDFDDERIINMDGEKALKFWEEWKNVIKKIIEKSPAR